MKKIYNAMTMLLVLLATSTMNAQALSGTYTIGDDTADYETFLLAIDDLQLEGVAEGGVTFTILPGVYDERILLENISGLSETSGITFFADPGSVTIEAVGSSTSNEAIIRVNDLSYITFDGIDIVDGSPSGSELEFGYHFVGTSAAGCSNNKITNSSIFLGASGARPITATRGIFFTSSGNSLETSNSNNIIDKVTIDNTSWGIQFRCAANFFGQITQPDFNNQVINSTFGANQSLGHDFSSGALAINALGGRDMIIKNNVIESVVNLNSAPALPVSTSGISLDSCSGEVTENEINNLEYEGTIGSVFGIRSSTWLGDTTLIANNKISGLLRSNFTASTSDPSFTITGIWIFNQGGNNGLASILHNSIFLEAELPVSYSSAGVNLSGGSTGQFPGEVFNNIIVNTISTSSPEYRSFGLVDGNTSRGFLISDYNDLYANGDNGYLGAIGRELGGTEQFTNSLEDFISFSETNENSVNFLPEFVDASSGDLSFADDLVATTAYLVPTLPEVPFDIEGTTRRSPETFLGAYEGTEVLSIKNSNFSSIAIYPNPTREVLNLSIPNMMSEEIAVRIYDQIGKQVLELQGLKFNGINSAAAVPVENLQSGMYFIKINSGSSEITKKFIVR